MFPYLFHLHKVGFLKGLSHGILSYFEHLQNYHQIEGNLKIIL